MFELQGKTGGSITIKFPQKAWGEAIFLLTSILVLVADQFTKIWVRSYAEGYPIFQSRLLQFVRGQNTGAVFGLFQGYSLILTVVTFVVIVVILLLGFLFWRRSYILGNPLAKTAVALYMGGASGNLIDRIRFGSVTDFIDFRFWPSFNVADAAMSVGVILFAYSILFVAKPVKRNCP